MHDTSVTQIEFGGAICARVAALGSRRGIATRRCFRRLRFGQCRTDQLEGPAVSRDVISLPDDLDLPRALGAPASTAVRSNGFVFTMGYMALDPETKDVSPGSIEHETKLTMDGLERGFKVEIEMIATC